MIKCPIFYACIFNSFKFTSHVIYMYYDYVLTNSIDVMFCFNVSYLHEVRQDVAYVLKCAQFFTLLKHTVCRNVNYQVHEIGEENIVCRSWCSLHSICLLVYYSLHFPQFLGPIRNRKFRKAVPIIFHILV